MLEDLQPPIRKTTCRVATVAAELSETDARILFDAVADTENWKIKTLTNELNKRGIRISDTPLLSHRFKNCSCFRNA